MLKNESYQHRFVQSIEALDEEQRQQFFTAFLKKKEVLILFLETLQQTLPRQCSSNEDVSELIESMRELP